MKPADQRSIDSPSFTKPGVLVNPHSGPNMRNMGTIMPPPPPEMNAVRIMAHGEVRTAAFGWAQTTSTPRVVMPMMREKPSTKQKKVSRGRAGSDRMVETIPVLAASSGMRLSAHSSQHGDQMMLSRKAAHP